MSTPTGLRGARIKMVPYSYVTKSYPALGTAVTAPFMPCHWDRILWSSLNSDHTLIPPNPPRCFRAHSLYVQHPKHTQNQITHTPGLLAVVVTENTGHSITSSWISTPHGPPGRLPLPSSGQTSVYLLLQGWHGWPRSRPHLSILLAPPTSQPRWMAISCQLLSSP